MILETRDRIPRQAPCIETASPSACFILKFEKHCVYGNPEERMINSYWNNEKKPQ
ncbi:unnamed protein product [Nyctereutes procyonoides]|uniref:(raccoon dog) hypothetical protein n=1 Tax=Nyctereutes procyonoides TaxID=34880 RepID=A0A811ZWN8_NYCPR|nr:unnamed protein product [Nyctereutes procyonoides]